MPSPADHQDDSHATRPSAATPITEAEQAGTTAPLDQPADRPARDHRRYLAGTAGALLLVAGFGGAALATTSTGAERAATIQSVDDDADSSARGNAHRAGPTATGLEDITLDELAEELERLGLEVHIAAADGGDDVNSNGNDGADGSDSADSPDDGADSIDPFEGMTDDEVDALSDEEFFERLERAGIEPEYVDGDPGADTDTNDSGEDDADHEDHGGEDEAPLATVTVNGDDIDTSGLSPEVAKKTEAIWQRFTKLVPADQRQMVANFELMAENYGGAHVYPTDNDPTKWNLGVGADLGDDLDYVLIHEFGHLLTLQAKEVPPGGNTGSCETYHTGEGCALKGSTFADFVAAFWPQEMRDTVLDLYESEDYDGLEKFYEENKDKFVTDYAASNPAEDLAETFAVFVTEDRPTGKTIADQKVELLWSDADMVNLRSQIRAAL